MLTIVPEALARYAATHTSAESPLLVELREETERDLAEAQMQVGRIEGALLKMLVGLSGAKRVLELGTFSGYSALCMAAALPDDGELITCDLDPKATTVAQRYWDRSPHGKKIKLRLGPALATLTQLAAAGTKFDVAFIDADKENYVAYWEAIIPMLHPGGLVIADNTLWSGNVLDPQKPSDHGIVNFNTGVAADDRVENVLLSVRDGVMLARKKRL